MLKRFLNDDELKCVGIINAHKRGSQEGSTVWFYETIGKVEPEQYRKLAKPMEFQDAVAAIF